MVSVVGSAEIVIDSRYPLLYSGSQTLKLGRKAQLLQPSQRAPLASGPQLAHFPALSEDTLCSDHQSQP